jgi:uncharacterized protein YgiM (DUF1202 family)
MKLTHLLAASLLPAGLLAVTVDPHDGGIRRQGLSCTVVASEVNCRSGPGTEFDVVTSLKKGFVGTFDCAKTGECIVLNGMKNWYVRAAPNDVLQIS